MYALVRSHTSNKDKQLLLLLDSQNGLNAQDSTLDNDFSLWSIHTTCNLLCKIRHVVVVLFAYCSVSKVPPGFEFELMIITGINFSRLSRVHEQYR